MQRPGGYAVITQHDGPQVEIDTFTCGHCNHVTHVKSRARPEDLGGLCKICMKPICTGCVGGVCDPFEEKLRRAEARYHALRSYGH